MSKATRRMISPVSENWSGILFHLSRKSHSSKSIFEVEGVPRDATLKDEEQMKESNKKLEKWKIGSRTKSICNNLKTTGDTIFCDESSCVIYEMGNLELIERRLFSVRLPLKHEPEGLKMCLCGVWSRPNQDTVNSIKARFEALITSYYRTAVTLSRGKKARTQSMAKRPCKNRRRKTRSKNTRQPHLLSEPMAE